jgi:SAM-dependent methyltransferase
MTGEVSTADGIDYDHSRNRHSVKDPRAALGILFPGGLPASCVDVGCGTGTWLRAIAEGGVADYIGVDGVEIPPADLLFKRDRFVRRDLRTKWDLGRRFEAAFCLEVAEHIEPEYAETLVDALARHSDTVIFSAACPGQPGQHHINCQWPSYWQGLFNARGYVCDDEARWQLWDKEGVDPWYKQNMFIARHAPGEAGREPRLRPVIHPEMVPFIEWYAKKEAAEELQSEISTGRKDLAWYLDNGARAIAAKLHRKLPGSGNEKPE